MSTILYRDGSTEMKDDFPIVVDDQIRLKKEFVVRMIKNTGNHKECIAEEIFEAYPSNSQIIWCLLKHPEATFAAVSDRYTLHRALPFD